MIALIVGLSLLTQTPDAVEAPPDPFTLPAPPLEVAPAPAEPPPPDPDRWQGEHKRVHVAIGLRAHGGLMSQQGTPFLLVQSGMFIGLDVRTVGHQEASVSFELSGGIPDTVSGETLLAYKFHLTPRFSLGAGLIFFWGFWSFRGGVEIPFAIRLGDQRKHEIGIAVRATAGVYNNISYVWWDFERQRFAMTLDGALTYRFVF